MKTNYRQFTAVLVILLIALFSFFVLKRSFRFPPEASPDGLLDLQLLSMSYTDDTQLFSVACGPGDTIITGEGGPPVVGIWQASTGTKIQELTGHSDSVTHVDISSNGSYIVSGGMDGKVILWEFGTGAIVKIWGLDSPNQYGNHFVSSLTFSSNGDMLAFSGTDRRVRLVFLADLDVVYVIDSFDDSNALGEISVAFSPDDRFLAIGSDSGELKILGLPDFQLEMRLSIGHKMKLMQFLRNRDELLLLDRDEGGVDVFNLVQQKVQTRLDVVGTDVRIVTYWEKEDILIAGTRDGTVEFWDLNSLAHKTTPNVSAWIGDICVFDGNGILAAVSHVPGSIWIWQFNESSD